MRCILLFEHTRLGVAELVLVARDWVGTVKEKFRVCVEGLLEGEDGEGLRMLGDGEESDLDEDVLQSANPRLWPCEGVCVITL